MPQPACLNQHAAASMPQPACLGQHAATSMQQPASQNLTRGCTSLAVILWCNAYISATRFTTPSPQQKCWRGRGIRPTDLPNGCILGGCTFGSVRDYHVLTVRWCAWWSVGAPKLLAQSRLHQEINLLTSAHTGTPACGLLSTTYHPNPLERMPRRLRLVPCRQV